MTSVLILDAHADWYVDALRAQGTGFTFHAARDVDAMTDGARDAEVLVALAPRLSADVIHSMPKLGWVQALTTGVDNLLAPGVLPNNVALTNCGGFHGPQMTELALMSMLACARQLPRMLDNHNRGQWERWEQPVLQGKTLCIVGLGSIAEYLANVCQALGMRVTGVSDGRRDAPGIDQIYTRAQMAVAAHEADFMVVLVPYSAATHHIIDAAVLSAMKPSAFLINIARGGCVDEDAVIAALDAGQIAGAALDVFATEPLPANSPFWGRKDVIVTPHIGGFADVYRQQALPIVAANLAAFAQGGVAALPNLNTQDRGAQAQSLKEPST